MPKMSPSLALATGQKTVTKQETNTIDQVAIQVENLSKEDALGAVLKLADDIDFNYFQLGGVLSVIQSNGWHTEGGHESFRAFVEQGYGIKYRKAMYLVGIYNALVEAEIPWENVKHLGWTKLKELAPILTQENVDYWAKAAADVTVLQLIAMIKNYMLEQTGGEEGGSEGESTSSASSTMTFKLHVDQKEVIRAALDQVKHEMNTEYDAVALESICLAFVAGGKIQVQKPSLKDVMLGSSWEDVLSTFEQLWPDVDVEVTTK